jgi:predicted nucleic acid-binding protein
MTASIFVDTNILIYALDTADAKKNTKQHGHDALNCGRVTSAGSASK